MSDIDWSKVQPGDRLVLKPVTVVMPIDSDGDFCVSGIFLGGYGTFRVHKSNVEAHLPAAPGVGDVVRVENHGTKLMVRSVFDEFLVVQPFDEPTSGTKLYDFAWVGSPYCVNVGRVSDIVRRANKKT